MSKNKNKKTFLRLGKKGFGPLITMILGVVLILGVAGVSYSGVKYLNANTKKTGAEALSIERQERAKEGLPEPLKQEGTTGIPCEIADSVVMKAVNKYTSADASAHDFELWMLGADTSDSNKKPVSNATTSSGKATDTSAYWESCFSSAKYDLYTEGGSTYYDGKIPEWYLVYQGMTADAKVKFKEDGIWTETHKVLPIGTFTDFDSSVLCNGQSTSTCGTTDSLELDDSGTDEITYNKTTGDGSFWLDYDVGNTVGQTSIKNTVLCFQDANTGTDALDGNEVSSMTITYRSGDGLITNQKLLGDLTTMWKEASGSGSYMCELIGTPIIDGAKSGTYRFTFGVTDANWGNDEQMKICLDDVGGYGKFEYPSGNAKATASCLTLKSRT